MSAQPVHELDPDDPVEILRVLPGRFHDQFLAEYYEAAGEAARQVGGYRQLHDLLRRWRLSAAAYSAPGVRGTPAGGAGGCPGRQPGRVGADRGGRARLAGPLVSYGVRFEGAALVQLNGLPRRRFRCPAAAGG
jgi:Family of unknown function (DUF6247)